MNNWTDKSVSGKIFSLETLVLILSVFVVLPRFIFGLPHNGLDPSWVIALNMALKQQLIFGQEVIFTSGPLGFLSTGQTALIPRVFLVLYHLILLFFVVFIFRYFIRMLPGTASRLVFLFVVILMLPGLYMSEAFIMFLIFEFFLLYYLKTGKRFGIGIAAFFALLSFFVKMNTGLVLTAIFLIFMVFIVFIKRERGWFAISFTGIYISLLLFFSYLLNVDVINYVLNTLAFVSQYNDGNCIPAPLNMLLIALVVIAIYFLIILLNVRLFLFDWIRLFSFGMISLAMFIVFKEGFVRADIHMIGFFIYIVPLLGLLYFFESHPVLKKHLFVGIVIISLLSSIAIFKINPDMGFPKLQYQNLTAIPYTDLFRGNYEERLNNAITAGKEECYFPDRILEKLEGKTVDIMPWDMSYLFFNDLKYNPRPTLQSFNAGCKQLDEINAAKYASETAPDYVLFTVGSIDHRHPFWDESLTKRTMLVHYEVDDTLHLDGNLRQWARSDFILLRKKTADVELVEINSQIIDYEIGDTLSIPQTDNLIYMYADIQYTLIGKLRRLLYQPNRLAVEMFHEDFKVPMTRITVIPILREGVPVNRRLINLDDATAFFNHSWQNNANVRCIRLTPKSMGIKDNVKIILKEYKLEKRIE